MSSAKNRNTPVPGIPFWQPLLAHGLIHGAAVAAITQIWWLGLAETVIHCVTDDAKCRGKINFTTDQIIHVLCKIAWFLIALIYWN